MRPSFLPRLVNPPQEDPAVYIPFSYQNSAILFDAGDLGPLTNRELLKIEHLFISHTHMDHFSGFDRLLRLILGREKILNLFGPKHFLRNLEGKFNSYQWNLVGQYAYPLIINATEITPSQWRSRTYRCQDKFSPSREKITRPESNILLKTPSHRITGAILDHRTPCLGLALEESFHINILKPKLTSLGLKPGPWLKTFKNNLYRQCPLDTVVEILPPFTQSSKTTFQLGTLVDTIARITPGQKIAYITDVGFTDENRHRIQNLIQGADHLFIEAAFLDKDKDIAREKYHLTARQAGYIAARAAVKQMSVFHFSPRYTDHFEEIEEEAHEAFVYFGQNQDETTS